MMFKIRLFYGGHLGFGGILFIIFIFYFSVNKYSLPGKFQYSIMVTGCDYWNIPLPNSDQSIHQKIIFGQVHSLKKIVYFCIKLWQILANSADPDETACYEPAHLDLHCLQTFDMEVCGAERVNTTCRIGALWGNLTDTNIHFLISLFKRKSEN